MRCTGHTCYRKPRKTPEPLIRLARRRAAVTDRVDGAGRFGGEALSIHDVDSWCRVLNNTEGLQPANRSSGGGERLDGGRKGPHLGSGPRPNPHSEWLRPG